ncbi:MAG: cysteine--tRNA ligase [Defluviitaleaceae bacterium]|nr:cysteine--tRNA ligase [Defluviitaleaceae bacterium]
MKIYNTLTRKKEELQTITPGMVKMYSCGQTVYNDIHLGNARFYVVFDAIRRYLLHKGYNVRFVQNFTDIDDKIIQRATEENCSTQEITQKYIANTKRDLAALNVLPATINPLATEEIGEIITMISELVAKGHAYENNGTVYFSVGKFEGYGKLSRKNIEDLEAGARVEVESGKANPMDFVLWKPAKPDEPHWESPWGNGRPGWHIECSAMIRKYLGDEIDIHGGGEDLTFPHHDNEIAQTEALTGCNLARYWMHSGLLTTNHKKMSKSSGNFSTFHEATKKIPAEVIRFYFLSGHYRMPMELTEDVLAAAKQSFGRIKNCHISLQEALKTLASSSETSTADITACQDKFMAAMDDDFNTADAITAIFDLVKIVNLRLADKENLTRHFAEAALTTLEHLCDILGLNIATQDDSGNNSEIEALVSARNEARKNKDFAESDRIRDQLLAMGIIIKDTREGVTWHRA